MDEWLALVPFEEREGMKGEHTPEIDLTRGTKFESSCLRLDRWVFFALLGVDTHLLWAFWNALRLPSVGFAFQEEKTSRFKATASPQDLVYPGQEEW